MYVFITLNKKNKKIELCIIQADVYIKRKYVYNKLQMSDTVVNTVANVIKSLGYFETCLHTYNEQETKEYSDKVKESCVRLEAALKDYRNIDKTEFIYKISESAIDNAEQSFIKMKQEFYSTV